jgi:hypothetical protein
LRFLHICNERGLSWAPWRRLARFTLLASGIGMALQDDARAAAPVTRTTPARAEQQCRAFQGRTFEGAVVTEAVLVAASGASPEHCLVRGEMPKDLDFEIRMPTSWNGRTVFAGGGGFDGRVTTVPYSMSAPAAGGYATIATNHGHNDNVTPGASFALDVEMLDEYAYLAVPRVLAPAKAILRARYGKRFSKSKLVFEGCSGGGRQALIQAQRFPDLFDGLISRAPANAYTPQFLWYHTVIAQLAQPGAALTAGKIRAIANAVNARCDQLDGLRDGIIGRPDACRFDPAELACADAENDSCLTPPQISSARAFYAPTNVANGRYVWPGFMPGGEDSWLDIRGARMLDEGYIKYMVAQNADIDPLTIDPARHTARIDYLVTLIDAVDPDLRPFKTHGGKLILWTGQSDWLITANNLTSYYNGVVKNSGSQAAADEFVEYYTSPSVGHCYGGTGADKVDLIGPMFDWLEKGIKPSVTTIVAGQRTVAPGAKPFTRPLCQYSKYPKYIGGDPSLAASFACTRAAPSASPDRKF